MDTVERLPFTERVVLRLARRFPSPYDSKVLTYGSAAGISLLMWLHAADLWEADRDEAVASLALWAAFMLLTLAMEGFYASLRLLARYGAAAPRVPEAAPDAKPSFEEKATVSVAGDAPAPDARRLARAPAYLAQLERLRWVLPAMVANAVLVSALAIAYLDVPRPVELLLAAAAGASIVAPLAQAAVRRWVRVVVALLAAPAPTR